MVELRPAGDAVFVKQRERRPRDAEAEWNAFETLASLDQRAPERIFRARLGARSAVGMAAVPGRPLDAWIHDGADVEEFATRQLAPAVRRLHDAGWVYRDLYWNHVFADDLDAPPIWIDVERLFRPAGRFQRWVVKDLAGLASSWPIGSPHGERVVGALLETYGVTSDVRRAVLAKATRIRSHTPKYG